MHSPCPRKEARADALRQSQNPDAGWALMQQHEHDMQQQHQQHAGSSSDLYDYQSHGQNGHDPFSGYYNGHPQQQAFSRQPVRLLAPPFRMGMPLTIPRQLPYHLYHPTSASAPTSSNPIPSFFLPPSLHQALTTKSEATHAAPSIDLKLPDDVGGYTGLLPLDKSGAGSGNEKGWMGYRSWLYKAWKVGAGPGGGGGGGGDGRVYVLRRIEGTFQLSHLGQRREKLTPSSSQASGCSMRPRFRSLTVGRECDIPVSSPFERPLPHGPLETTVRFLLPLAASTPSDPVPL